MFGFIARAILKRALGKMSIKKNIFDALRAKAKETENKLDDAGVDALEIGWDVIIPIIIGKL